MRLRSRCANAAHAENTMVMTASHCSVARTLGNCICAAKIGGSTRMKPYMPIFDITPVSSIVTEDGHVWFHSRDRKSTRLNSSHSQISYAVFCLKKKKNITLCC